MARHLLVVLIATLCCAPLWAGWPSSGEADELAEQLKGFATRAINEASKCLDAQPPDFNQARYLLLAISDLCVPSADAGFDPKVPADVVAAYKALYPRAWANGAPTEKEFSNAVKDYAEQFQDAYINAFYIVDNAETYTIKNLLTEFSKGESRHAEAVKLALEFAGKSLPPEAFMKYCFGGKQAFDANQIQAKLANIYAGPEAIREKCRTALVKEAVDSAIQQLGYWDANEADPLVLKAQARELESDFLDFIAWADPENAKLKELRGKVAARRDKAKAIYAAQVKENRVPRDNYAGDDKEALKAAMQQEFHYEQEYTVLRVVISDAQWREQAHVWSGINALDVGWYKLIDGAVVIKLKDGTVWVHPLTFGKRWTGTGDNYGPVKVYSWADRYEVLPANLNK